MGAAGLKGFVRGHHDAVRRAGPMAVRGGTAQPILDRGLHVPRDRARLRARRLRDRRVLASHRGWRAHTAMRAELLLDALEQALHNRELDGRLLVQPGSQLAVRHAAVHGPCVGGWVGPLRRLRWRK